MQLQHLGNRHVRMRLGPTRNVAKTDFGIADVLSANFTMVELKRFQAGTVARCVLPSGRCILNARRGGQCVMRLEVMGVCDEDISVFQLNRIRELHSAQ